ncbi:heme lyase CcmF/NrfE family subunit [Propionivibrio dicarboxylicus]|uniref:Cytochrome c-type biogenesis protein CcmF n=1 Tax=Propionivibrio dicarboxylicus TaxID=83767 RepID=A0A1G8M9S1_9RHOO|nr:heme lyase CcmF/NrfE family subunit [Propionivibrio dicarboxylicus]SDI64729.1 cytochrome c-type biogenesis protein CcmF [Propionivibrio dicarboxylicus]
MIPELGHIGLIVALQLALVQAALGFSGARGRMAHAAAARGAAIGQSLLVVFGFATLVWAFAVNDFSVLNVAEHSSRHLPLGYRITAAWGSHEGSILLWAVLLGLWTVTVAVSRGAADDLGSGALAVLGAINAGMLAFILFTSNPFQRLDPPPPDGLDLNPLLQDPGMVAHPPLLYLGYVGFAVAFAFAVAALLCGRLDADWAKRAQPWTRLAWAFLTLGIAVGSGWAYYELGWGGWWFWDPTENASLMPWLVGTALLHSLGMTGRRGGFQVWTMSLAIGTFGLSLIGTFLVRSGVLSSVHAFAQDPARGFFLLLLLALLVGAALTILARRASAAAPTAPFAWLSRETLVLGGNMLLLVATGSVLLGTLYPLVLDALGQGKVSVGPPYFNAVFVPLMAPVLLLAGAAPFAGWQQADRVVFWRGLRLPALSALVAAPLLSLALGGEVQGWAVLALALSVWIVVATAMGVIRAGLSWRRLGMALAHGGLAVVVVGIGLVSSFESEHSLTVTRGERFSFAGYALRFDGVVEVPGPNYSAVRATVAVLGSGDTPLATLSPEKRIYHASKLPMTESAILSRPGGDLYVVLGDPLSLDAWTLRVLAKPFIAWIWAGAVLMALGAVLAAMAGRKSLAGECA